MNTMEIDKTFIADTYKRFPVEFEKGKGSYLYDGDGFKYVDMSAGIAVNTFGLCDDEWTAAVTKQLGLLAHTSNLFYSEPDAMLAKMICEKTGMRRVFFSNSGAEANECAIKTARKWARLRYGDDSHATIVTLRGGFHGRTVTTLTATAQDELHEDFGPFTPGFVYADPDDPEDLKNVVAENNCCAIMFETIQGEGGVHVLSKEYVDVIRSLCEKGSLLMIVDEVQTGNGRTGSLYSYMNYGLNPDIFTTAKGLGGGLPIGATVFGTKTADVLTPGSHGSTFGGNPVVCAGALNILSRLDDEALKYVRETGAYIRSELAEAPGVEEVTGMGLMIGVKTAKPAAEVAAACLENGCAVLTAKDRLRLLPALNIPRKAVEDALDIIKDAIDPEAE
ncbi:MAG: acetylornithine transaminase [Clostridiales bacterium]|nr:acetylornithine transaminase [Clostridiales bacterium]